jgi:hypothetical protein
LLTPEMVKEIVAVIGEPWSILLAVLQGGLGKL